MGVYSMMMLVGTIGVVIVLENGLLIDTKLRSNEMTTKEEKWFWMMDWCKTNNVAPSEAYWWNKAEEAYEAKEQ